MPSISAKICLLSKCFALIALLGHAATHVPHPLQSASLMIETFFSSSKRIARYGQRLLQMRQPEHFSSSISAVAASISIFSRMIIDRTALEAAEACATCLLYTSPSPRDCS